MAAISSYSKAPTAVPGLFTYDPKQFSLTLGGVGGVGGQIIVGFADDDFIEIERDEDAWTKKVGVDGEVTRAKTNNKAGKVIIRLMQSSPSNDFLSAMALADEAANVGTVSIWCADGSGRSAFQSDFAWVKKFPKTSWKKGVEVWEWTLETGNLTIYIGGN